MFHPNLHTRHIYSNSLHVSITIVLIIRRINVLIRHLVYVTLCRGPSSVHTRHIYSNSLHVSITFVLIIRRINCINTTSDICQSLSSVQVWMFPPNLHSRHGVTYRLQDVVLIQLILLMMSTKVIETCRELE
jgi:hypothetical protein